MPKVDANNITINYEEQGDGEPLLLIPYLTADHACYAFQVAEYAKHFTCISLDLRGTGESSAPGDAYTTEGLADDVAAFMHAAGISTAHISGMSLGAAVGMWLAVKHPRKVRSLSLHGPWPRTDPFLENILEGWRVMATALGSVQEMVIRSIFPWCFTPELYAARPEFIQSLADFVRSRPPQSLTAFMLQSNAALGHDVAARLDRISAPTLITFGSRDQLTSTRFADQLTARIRQSELTMFEHAAHGALYEKVEEFNQKTLRFLLRHSGLAMQPA
jgi:pimeloyl-ACP methyl ester carboxylesterase